jgi:glycerol-3-phosphate dehydrogenase (NAD(P)+)
VSQQRHARAAVFSAGSWGTAMAKVLADAGTDVIVHARRNEIADAINTAHRNPGYFPDSELPPSLAATTDPAVALDGADYLVLSVPAHRARHRDRVAHEGHRGGHRKTGERGHH